jgi:NAD(P)H-flavin reductase
MTRTKRPDDTVQLDNLAIAAALMASGCKLVKAERISPRHYQFTLKGPDAKMLASDYFMAKFDLLRTHVRMGGGR